MTINSNAMVEPNKIVNISNVIGHFDFNIRHSGVTAVTKDILGGSGSFLTIEPGKYRVTFNSVYTGVVWLSMNINYYTKSGEQRYVHNTVYSNSSPLETVTHEVDFTNIGNYNSNSLYPFMISCYINNNSFGEYGTIIFEAID